MKSMRRVAGAALAALLVGHAPAWAQPFEQAGVRALGMGGAFVAVADDATAVWWNPAGLASGPFFNLTLEYQSRRREPAEDVSLLDRPAIDQSVTGFALATPPLGLSYQRTRYTTVPAASPANGREEIRPGDVRVDSLVAHQTGVTLLQTIAPGLVVGTTLKFVRGVAARGTHVERGTEVVLEAGSELVGKATNRFDADVGVHFRFGPLRAGVTVRNVAEPSFDSLDGETFELARQARAGIAWSLTEATTIAADVDLTERAEDPAGHGAAFGVEHRVGLRFALRGGARLSTGEDGDSGLSAGGSYAVRPGVWVDGFWDQAGHGDRRWGLAGRLTY